MELSKSKEVFKRHLFLSNLQGASEFVTCDARRKDSDRRKDFHRGFYNLRYNTSLLHFKVDFFLTNRLSGLMKVGFPDYISFAIYVSIYALLDCTLQVSVK